MHWSRRLWAKLSQSSRTLIASGKKVSLLNGFLLIKILISYEANIPQLPNEDALELVLEAFLLFLMTQKNEKYMPQLKTCLKCMVQLCEACPSRCQYFVELVSEQVAINQGNSKNYLPSCRLGILLFFLQHCFFWSKPWLQWRAVLQTLHCS